MINSVDILFGVASQTVYHDAPQGRASSVTSVTVYRDTGSDDGPTESTALGTPAVDTSPNTTVDATCGASAANPRKVSIAATTGCAIGRQYLLSNVALGQSEWVEVAGIASADYVIARHPLAHEYATSDTFVTSRMSATVDTTWASAANNLSNPYSPWPRYRVAWVYTVNSVVYREATYFDVVRYPSTFGVTGTDCDRASPGWLDRLPTDYRAGQGAQAIVMAARQVKWDLARTGRTDWAERNTEAFSELIILQAESWSQRASFGHGGQNADQLARAEARYAAFLKEFVFEAKSPTQITASGTGGQPERAPIWSR